MQSGSNRPRRKALRHISRELKSEKIKILARNPATCAIRNRSTIYSAPSAANSSGSISWSTTPASPTPISQSTSYPLPIWQDVIDTNLTGTFLVTQAALAIMKRGGTIVNNLSIVANRAFAGSAAYIASKHGALGLTNTSP